MVGWQLDGTASERRMVCVAGGENLNWLIPRCPDAAWFKFIQFSPGSAGGRGGTGVSGCGWGVFEMDNIILLSTLSFLYRGEDGMGGWVMVIGECQIYSIR